MLQNKRIVLGVTGSIACYKAADLASKLTQAGALVDVIVTDSAARFITPLTFRSVTGRPTYNDMWDTREHVQHVGLGEQADLLIIAPCTAHTLAKLAHGMADNLLTVTALTARCPVIVAPAMDGGMYDHAAVQANLATLQSRNITIAEPNEGRMASGLVGRGRLQETPQLLGLIRRTLGQTGELAGKRVLVTAGATEEPLDPVRYLTNRSSGKQGIAIAQTALDRGAEVTLITGSIHQPIPVGCNWIEIRTAQALHDAVIAQVQAHDVLVMAAAVADFRPDTIADRKIKKKPSDDSAPTIQLTRNPDILAAVSQLEHECFVVGFAAETHDVIAYGSDKLKRKRLDLIVINDVSQRDSGFAVDTNAVTIVGKDGIIGTHAVQSKMAIAGHVWDAIQDRIGINVGAAG